MFLKQSSRELPQNGYNLTTYTRASSPHQSISSHADQAFVDGAGENTPCALHARRAVFPVAPVDLAHQQQHVADGGRPHPRPQRVVCVLRMGRMQQSRPRGDWQGSRSRYNLYPIPSVRGEARGVCQWVAGDSSSGTSTPIARVLLLAQQIE